MSLTFSVWQRPGEIYLGGEGEGGRETAAFIRGENIFKSRLGSLDSPVAGLDGSRQPSPHFGLVPLWEPQISGPQSDIVLRYAR